VVDPGQFIQSAPTVVTLTLGGYIKRLPLATYKRQQRGGKGVVGMATREDDVVQHLIVCDTKDTLYLFTDRGRVYSRPCYVVKEAPRQSRGVLLSNLLGLENERVTSIIPISDITLTPSILLATKRGVIKRMPAAALSSIRPSGIIAMNLKENDELVAARLASNNEYVIEVTRRGKGVRFLVSEVPLRSRVAGGVKGVRLARGDEVIAMDVAGEGGMLFTVSVLGFGKVTNMAEFPTHHRGGGGVIAHRVNDRTGQLAWAGVVESSQEEVIVASANGMVQRTTLEEVNAKGRAAMGVHVMALDEGDRVSAVACMEEPHVAEAPSAAPNGAAVNGASTNVAFVNGTSVETVDEDAPVEENEDVEEAQDDQE